MKKILSLNIAVTGTIIIISCVIVFHLLVLAGFIPSNIVWGGNLADKQQLYTMEIVSIAINVLMLFVILVYSGVVIAAINRKIIIGVIWLMFGLFLLNTVGNLLAKNSLETHIFTPITFVLSLFCLRIGVYEYGRKNPSN